MSVTTLQLAKDWLQIKHTAQDAVVQMLLDGAESELEKLLNVLFSSQTITEDLTADTSELPLYPNPRFNISNGCQYLMPTKRPVTAVASVKDHRNDDADMPFLLKDDLLFSADQTGSLQFGVWPAGINRYQAIYTAGYAALPGGLTRAVLMLVSMDYAARGGETTLTGAGQSQVFRSREDLLKSVERDFSRRALAAS